MSIGIDLGTTNSALAWAPSRGPLRIFDIVQLVAPGEAAARPTLPSFLYIPDDDERERGVVALPWDTAPDFVAGAFARDAGGLVPARQVASAKSWLSNARVDRTAPLLPWGVEGGPRLSPVAASTQLLAHLREAWNHARSGSGDGPGLERQPIVLTVPASFDEEARELTVQAARDAGFEDLTLLEEPLAALYAWIAVHRRDLAATFSSGALILVCDVGGGTTDFSLIRAAIDAEDGDLRFERIAIGEHLLLGGDNLDLSLAAALEQRMGGTARLTLTQRLALRRKCSEAKEQLLSTPDLERVPITILGAGRGVVGGGLTGELTRAEVVSALTEGFLPLTAADDLPPRERRVGLRELGLPYETEPAITRHLAAFLVRAGGGPMARPDAVLFNGGFFTPPIARERVLDALSAWFGERPHVLENDRPEAAVAIGAAFYGRLRQDPARSKRLLIRAGSARAYYVGVGRADAPEPGASAAASRAQDGEGTVAAGELTHAVCVLPRGTEEGTRLALDREFTVIANTPAAFTLYSSTEGSDAAGTLATFSSGGDVMRHAPLVTAFRFGKRSRRVPLGVRLEAVFTETGTLELWCQSMSTEHRWRLSFNLRGVEGMQEDDTPADEQGGEASVVIADASIDRAAGLIRAAFSSGSLAPDALVGEIETSLGHGKPAWPLGAIRRLADVLLEVAPGRTASAAHEARWLNLTGFCIRPGFGSSSDEWRVSELRRVYAAGLAFPKDVQNQVEWIVLWGRVGAGFTTGQQRELAQRMTGLLGLGARKPPRLNPQIEREAWRLLASLERLDAGQRTKLGDELLEKIRREPGHAAWLWALGRLGARTPLYGPLNTVVPPAVGERWIARVTALKELVPEAAGAIAEIASRTGDPTRDLPDEVVESAAIRLEASGYSAAANRLRSGPGSARTEAGRIFGESLPEGLRLPSLAAE